MAFHAHRRGGARSTTVADALGDDSGCHVSGCGENAICRHRDGTAGSTGSSGAPQGNVQGFAGFQIDCEAQCRVATAASDALRNQGRCTEAGRRDVAGMVDHHTASGSAIAGAAAYSQVKSLCAFVEAGTKVEVGIASTTANRLRQQSGGLRTGGSDFTLLVDGDCGCTAGRTARPANSQEHGLTGRWIRTADGQNDVDSGVTTAATDRLSGEGIRMIADGLQKGLGCLAAIDQDRTAISTGSACSSDTGDEGTTEGGNRYRQH